MPGTPVAEAWVEVCKGSQAAATQRHITVTLGEKSTGERLRESVVSEGPVPAH